MQEAVVRQQEEVAERVDQRLGLLGVLQLVQVEDHAEHEHRGEHGPDEVGDARGERLGTQQRQAHADRGEDRGADLPRDRQVAHADQKHGQQQDVPGGAEAEDPGQPGDRDRHEAGLLPAIGEQVVDGQGGQREGHQHLEGAALDPVHLEDGQEQSEVRQDRQELAEVAPAGLGLAGIETPPRRRHWSVLAMGRWP